MIVENERKQAKDKDEKVKKQVESEKKDDKKKEKEGGDS